MNTILLVGVGGYGALTAAEVLKNAEKHGARVVGVVEPFLNAGPVKDEIARQNIPVFDSLEAFYAQNGADLAILSTPIHLHEAQSTFCLKKGSDVLCEKPIAPTLQEAYAMRACAEETKRKLHIGFQLSFAPGVLKLKQDVLSGRFGRPKSMNALICWPRNDAYFARPWAAKKRINGQYVLDSIAMNACAHYLHNALFLLGERMDASAAPASLSGFLARANDIEMFDTALLEVTTAFGVPVRFSATHASRENVDPLLRYEFEHAVVTLDEGGGGDRILARTDTGETLHYGATYDARFEKVWYALDCLRGEKTPVCTVETAIPHLQCVNAATEFLPIRTFENRERADDRWFVPGLTETLEAAFASGRMPWDAFAPSGPVDLTDYHAFGGLK